MKRFDIKQAAQVLQRIYDSEINVQISSFWDGGFNFEIGDEVNGFQIITPKMVNTVKDKEIDGRKIEDVVSLIAHYVTILYPTSTFTKWYNSIN